MRPFFIHSGIPLLVRRHFMLKRFLVSRQMYDVRICIKISMKSVPNGTIVNKSGLGVQVIACFL